MASSLMGVMETELLQGEVAVGHGMGREELALAAVRQLARDVGVNPHHVRIHQTPYNSSCDWVIIGRRVDVAPALEKMFGSAIAGAVLTDFDEKTEMGFTIVNKAGWALTFDAEDGEIVVPGETKSPYTCGRVASNPPRRPSQAHAQIVFTGCKSAEASIWLFAAEDKRLKTDWFCSVTSNKAITHPGWNTVEQWAEHPKGIAINTTQSKGSRVEHLDYASATKDVMNEFIPHALTMSVLNAKVFARVQVYGA